MTIQKYRNWIAIASLTLMTTIANADQPSVSGNSEGRLLASNCFQCHGTFGSGGFDSIIGEDDLLGELNEFLNENAPNDIMAAHLKGYTPAQLRAIADYFANP